MATYRAFAYNTGSTFPNTIQVGNVVVQTGSPVTESIRWWNGPDEDLGYVIAHSTPGGNQPNPDDQPAYIGFWRSFGLTDSAFLVIANHVAAGQETFTTTSAAVTWLNNNGYWTSYLVINYIILASNVGMSYAIKDGQIWGWGWNYSGQLGNNSTLNKSIPVSICGVKKTFCKINMNGDSGSVIAIDKYGQVWSWGGNSYGQLGDNSIVAKCTPVSICGVKKTFCEIQISTFASGIDKYGQIWGWGYNNYGQLGNNSLISQRTPISICGVKKTFCKITTGENFTLAIDKYGQIWGWGYNYYGQLGNNSIISRRTPISICGVKKTFCKITTGGNFTLSIDKYGQVWGWGQNNYGQLGNNSIVNTSTPISILGVKKTFCQIVTTYRGTLAIDKYGQIWGWGYNYHGSIGNNSNVNRCTPVKICGLNKTFCKISAGTFHVLAIDKNGNIWGWGRNNIGQLGNNGEVDKSTPVRVCNNSTFCNISAGGEHSLATDKNKKVWGWGGGYAGKLGNNNTNPFSTPVAVCVL